MREATSKLFPRRTLPRNIALRLRHISRSNNTLLRTGLLLQIGLDSRLRRNSVSLVLAERVLSVRVATFGKSASVADSLGFDLRCLALVDNGALVDLITGLVDKARAGLVARGEGHLALHGFDLLFVEQVAVFVAELDFLLADDAFGLLDCCRRARGDFDVLLGVFGDGRGGADVCLGGGGGTGGWDVVDGVFCVLWLRVLVMFICS